MAVATAERGTTHQKTSTKFEKQKHHSRLINLSLFLWEERVLDAKIDNNNNNTVPDLTRETTTMAAETKEDDKRTLFERVHGLKQNVEAMEAKEMYYTEPAIGK